MRKLFIIVGLFAAAASHAQGLQSNEVREAFMRAVKSPEGRYEGPLTGATVAGIQRRFRTDAPFFIRITTIHHFKQKGCKRLQSNIYAPDSMIKRADGTSAPFDFGFQMNLCPDGRPPSDETYVQPPGSDQVTLDDWAKKQSTAPAAKPRP